MESELFAEFAGMDGHEGNDYSEYANLHAYIERPDDFYKKLYDEKLVLNHAHFYEWDEWENESLDEKFNHLHHLIMKEIVDFCKRNNINADAVTFSADYLYDSLNAGNWHPSTDSALVLFDKDKKRIIESV